MGKKCQCAFFFSGIEYEIDTQRTYFVRKVIFNCWNFVKFLLDFIMFTIFLKRNFDCHNLKIDIRCVIFAIFDSNAPFIFAYGQTCDRANTKNAHKNRLFSFLLCFYWDRLINTTFESLNCRVKWSLLGMRRWKLCFFSYFYTHQIPSQMITTQYLPILPDIKMLTFRCDTKSIDRIFGNIPIFNLNLTIIKPFANWCSLFFLCIHDIFLLSKLYGIWSSIYELKHIQFAKALIQICWM